MAAIQLVALEAELIHDVNVDPKAVASLFDQLDLMQRPDLDVARGLSKPQVVPASQQPGQEEIAQIREEGARVMT